MKRKLQVWSTKDLQEAGLSRRSIAAKVADGTFIRCSAGWFATALTPADVTEALRRGHRLTCISALDHHGAWVPLTSCRHEIVRRGGASDTASAFGPGVRTHGRLRSWPDDEPIMPVLVALEHAARCLSVEDFAILLDSVAHLRLAHRDDLEELLRSLPGKVRRGIGEIEPRAESGTETRVRRFLRRLGAHVEVQVRIAGVGRVDLVLGERLIIECDSREHHTREDAYQEDRRRDRQAMLHGYAVIRLTWRDVMITWERTMEYLRALVRRQIHRAPRIRRDGAPVSRPRLRTRPTIRARGAATRTLLGASQMATAAARDADPSGATSARLPR